MQVLHKMAVVDVAVAGGLAALWVVAGPAAAQGTGVSTQGPVTIEVPLPLALPKARSKLGTPGVLRIVTWNLDGSVPASLTRKFTKAKPIWRTTFGPRKTAAAGPGGRPPKITGDVIALQSVRDLRIVRRLFPARDYYVIVSRQLLKDRAVANRSGNALQANGGARSPQEGTSAIVIGRRSGLRLLRQEQLLRFAGNPLQDPNRPRRSAAVALLLRGKGQRFWVMSVDLSWDCAAEGPATVSGAAPPPPACQSLPEPERRAQLALLRSWLKEKRKTGAPVLISGSFNSALGESKDEGKGVGKDDGNPGGAESIAARLSGVSVRKMLAAEPVAQASSAAPKRFSVPADSAKASAPLCSHSPQAARDGILLDVAPREGKPAKVSGQVVAIAGARHCPLILDVTF